MALTGKNRFLFELVDFEEGLLLEGNGRRGRLKAVGFVCKEVGEEAIVLVEDETGMNQRN
ncbi:hypothetical protein COLO4_36256 [Corchorus olitorius]|uniref:Uncharacterized protein n=1 Tax=Corchorus olitorius TaxID=93759 RepID=A0A1R3GAB5_9ROSI|nr:hypothetical protein COLO4_36256 [Corchorus olitorius]